MSHTVSHQTVQRALDALRAKPMTFLQLAERLDVSPGAARQALDELQQRHCADWEPGSHHGQHKCARVWVVTRSAPLQLDPLPTRRPPGGDQRSGRAKAAAQAAEQRPAAGPAPDAAPDAASVPDAAPAKASSATVEQQAFDLLLDGPTSATALSVAIGCSQNMVYHVLRSMQSRGEVESLSPQHPEYPAGRDRGRVWRVLRCRPAAATQALHYIQGAAA